MADESLFNRNLVTLGIRHPELAAILPEIPANPDLSIIKSRKGSLVPVLHREGHAFPMHSRFDPVSEGNRIAEEAPEGYIIAFGLGGAYHLKALLKKKTVTGLMVVEKDLSLLRAILELMDLTGLLSDSRVLLVIDPTSEDLSRIVLDRYLPVLYGNLGSITLRSRWDSNPDWFTRRAEALRGLPEALGRDYAVQTRFGRRWFVHTILNLARSEKVSAILPPARRLLITAAGPSLEQQLPEIQEKHSKGATLLATDTSLPLLITRGITPDIVISIDCQVVSYHHFLKGLPQSTVLVLDLASPPVLTRLTDKILFFSSGHPFSLYLNRLYRPFPILNLSGGNVTHAAVSLAQAAGAKEVHLYGADFSYPFGQAYARGTYIYPYFQSRSERTGSSEDSFWKFIRGSHPRRESNGEMWRIRTSFMDHYRESLEEAAESMNLNLIPAAGSGVPIRHRYIKKPVSTGKSDSVVPILSAGPITIGWKDFLEDYASRLESLPPLNEPPQDYLAELDTENRQAWATLLPSAATFRSDSKDGPSSVKDAREWTLGRIRQIPR